MCYDMVVIQNITALNLGKERRCMFNIGSLILGLCAWLFAILAMTACDGPTSHRNSTVSFSLCAVSLVLQLLEIHRRVLLGDYAAIADTIRAILIASAALVSVTVILNLTAIAKAKKK